MDDMIVRAKKFATEAHRRIDHRRKYTQQPYDVHLKSVADRVAAISDDPEMIAAAWLHDVVEDTPATVGDVEREFGRGVAELVSELTDVSRPSDGSRAVRKAMDREHTARASPRAKTIKLADVIDNGKDICAHDHRFARVYVGEMSALLDVLGDGDASLYQEAQGVLRHCAKRLGVPHLFPEVYQDPEETRRDDLSVEHRRALRLFTEAFTARDIADPLRSFDKKQSAGAVASVLNAHGQDVAAICCDGVAVGYVCLEDLAVGDCGKNCRDFGRDQIVDGDVPLSDVIDVLTRRDFCFVTSMGNVSAVIDRGCIQKPLARMWLFGIVTLIEMDVGNRIRSTWPNGEWVELLSAGRRKKAQDFLEERRRRGQHLDLLDCLQLSDKGHILMQNQAQREALGLPSMKAANRVIKELVSLRDNLAHASDIVTHDWPQIARMARNVEELVTGRR